MTLLLKGKAWAEFKRWCGVRQLSPLPAHPWTLAAYARWCEPKQTFADIDLSLKSIARQHLLAGLAVPNRHPTVKNTLRLIEVRCANRHNNAALFDGDDFLKTTPPQAKLVQEPEPDSGPAKTRKTALTMRSAPRLVRRR
ncbi:MAG TPA: hypothetical protein ENI69_10900 [Rhodospirillales bacterium]|nr:hypothetical protein [Rhodospirillales bacterium]